MHVIVFPIPAPMARTLKRDKCRVRMVGKWRFEVTNRRGTRYTVVLSKALNGFAYTCHKSDGTVCQSSMFGNICRHAWSAAMLCMGRNEMRKSVATRNVLKFKAA